MNKQAKFTFNKGMNQDISKYKHPGEFYFEGNAIRVINTDEQTLYGVSNEKGNRLDVTLPAPTVDSTNNVIRYGDSTVPFINSPNNEILNSDLPMTSGTQIIIGHAVTRNGVVILSTDNNNFDCIWLLDNIIEGAYNLSLLYCRSLGFSTARPIQALFNYENENIQKVYWVDGENQLRFINIEHSVANGDTEELMDLNSSSIDIVSDYSLSQPMLNSIVGGGVHRAGVIQYAYNLYRLNGSQTTISPLSELISLDNGATGGGALNEIVGSSPSMTIPRLDTNYTSIRIYSIKYTSFNETPAIALIEDSLIDSYTNYTFTDDGNNIRTLTLSEFLFLGGNPLVPRHIESKDSRLFAANLQDSAYRLEIDTRAYSHDSSGATRLYTGNVSYNNGVLTGPNQSFSAGTPITDYNYLTGDDAINPDYDTYRFQKNGTTIGGEGLYLSYEIVQQTESELEGDLKYLKFFKDDEIYRIGIQFYNRLGQTTEVKWIADFKAPSGNLAGNYNTLRVTLKTTALTAYLNSLNLTDDTTPVGYKIVRAEREISDRTILCQGSLTGMMVQTTVDARNTGFWSNEGNRNAQSPREVKLPIPISRGFVTPSNEFVIFPTRNLQPMNDSPGSGFDENRTEIYADADPDYKNQQSWQYTKLFQMHSPDILFNTGLSFSNNLNLNVIGGVEHTSTNFWYQRIRTATGEPRERYQAVNTNLVSNISGGFLHTTRLPFSQGLIGPNFDGERDGWMDQLMYNRRYHNFVEASNDTNFAIYGAPEITERGAGTNSYNGDSNFRYTNSLQSIITDRRKESRNNNQDEPAITSMNSFGERCLTIVEGVTTNEADKKTLEELRPSNIQNFNGLLLAQITRPISYIYNNGVYGGLSNENKSRTSYVEIGTYNDLTVATTNIESPGDTFVQIFKCARISKTDTNVLRFDVAQLTEIIEFPVETTVNLQNRNDISLFEWDNTFQPRYDDYHQYNRVYSQDSNLVRRATDAVNVRRVNNFDTRIIASRLKIPNETIDSWTDFLENDTMDLDGKYGAINALVNTRDEIYALQDTAVARMSINPRIQTQGSDGVGIELGRGAILYDYNYLTTQSGTINKWSVHSSPTSFYYLDAINKSYMRVNTTVGVANLSDQFGMHSTLQRDLLVNSIMQDNPLIGRGVVGGYDVVNGDSYMTVLQRDNNFTLRFSEKNNAFYSFHPYTPSRYINKGDIFITTSPDNNKLYTQGEGNYNEFYGQYHPSTITLLINPEADMDCVFNNIEYKSEAYINGVDQPGSTLTHMTAWNEYQNTGRVQLILGRNSNLRRKFRKWKAIIARNQGTRDRMRNPWLFLKLELDRNDNTRFVLHDIIINYTI